MYVLYYRYGYQRRIVFKLLFSFFFMGFYKWIKQKKKRKRRRSKIARKRGERDLSYKAKKNKDGERINIKN